jgi:hypothetical protein
VKSSTVIMAQFTWQSWGFGFVEMSTATESKLQACLRGAVRDPIGTPTPHVQRGEAQAEDFRGRF